MKIGFDAKRAFFNNTGLGQFSRTLVQDLEQFVPENDYYLFSPKLPNEALELKSTVVYPEQNRLFWRSYGIKKEIKNKKIELYHGLSNEVPFFAHQTRSCKFIVSIHDLIPLKFPQWYPFIDSKIYAAKMRYACKHADKIVAISQTTLNDILELGLAKENKVQLIYQSLSRPYRNLDIQKKAKKPYLLYVGSFSERKNILFLIELFAQIKDKIPHQLILIGNGKLRYQKKMMDLAVQHGIEKRIGVLGNISNADLPKYYNAADLFLYPSIYEGFGLPVAESIACGTAVISTANTSMEEAGGGGTISLPLEKELWQASILHLLDHPKKSEELVKAGKKHIQQYSPEKIAEDWRELYNVLSA